MSLRSEEQPMPGIVSRPGPAGAGRRWSRIVSKRARRFAGIALISAATLILELALLRLFAVQQFYHFAFMAISLALLGAGASGTFLTLFDRRLSPAGLALCFSLSALAAYLIINYLPFDSFSIAWDSRQLFFLALYFLAAAVPFFFTGTLIGGQLMGGGQENGISDSHQVYGANLLGSAAGSLASLPALAAFGGEGAVVLAVSVAALAGLLFGPARKGSGWLSAGGLITTLCVGVLVVGLAFLARPPAVLSQQLSPYKTLSILTQVFDARHRLTDWDAAARIDVIESNTIHIMPGLSLLSPVAPPPQVGLTLDGDNLMPITGLSPDSEEAPLLADHMPNGLAYHLRPRGRTLVLEAGTGMDVLMALAAGAESVTAVEENGLVLEVVRDRYRDFTGDLYSDPRLILVNQSGRVFVRRPDQGDYQILILALNDPHRPVTSGAYSLTENYHYTVEAFRDYLRLLGQDGLLVVTRWLQTPPSESLRTFGAVVTALREMGKDPGDHLVAYRSLRTMTLIASGEPFKDGEVEVVADFLATRGYDAVYYPGIRPEVMNRFNVLPEPEYETLFARLLEDADSLYAEYRFDIRPPTDDRPFFFHYFKWRQTPEILAGFGLSWQPFGGSGFFVLVALLLLVGLASAAFILSPLLVSRFGRGRRGHESTAIGRLPIFLYFAALGLAFLFVEVPLAQRFILILDQPVLALAVVLFAILLFSGLGSLTVQRWRLSRGLALLVALIAVYPMLLRPLADFALTLPAWGRVSLAILAVAPLGYLMGLPFAGGLRIIERLAPDLVPWAWAINGCFSVISSVLAVMTALSWGFPAVFWSGAAAYGLAWFVIWGNKIR